MVFIHSIGPPAFLRQLRNVFFSQISCCLPALRSRSRPSHRAAAPRRHGQQTTGSCSRYRSSSISRRQARPMSFRLPQSHRRVLEGELSFPLLEGHRSAGFALYISRPPARAVPVDRTRAARCSRHRAARIDPGCSSHAGNHYKLRRLSPPAHGTRTTAFVRRIALNARGVSSPPRPGPTSPRPRFPRARSCARVLHPVRGLQSRRILLSAKAWLRPQAERRDFTRLRHPRRCDAQAGRSPSGVRRRALLLRRSPRCACAAAPAEGVRCWKFGTSRTRPRREFACWILSARWRGVCAFSGARVVAAAE